ncbi:MAG: hypothetical protein RL385_1734 [Pseudomonadota bacterium]|jgi:hypothetical protein
MGRRRARYLYYTRPASPTCKPPYGGKSRPMRMSTIFSE